jgi:hypothetical protein
MFMVLSILILGSIFQPLSHILRASSGGGMFGSGSGPHGGPPLAPDILLLQMDLGSI